LFFIDIISTFINLGFEVFP